MHIRLHTSPSDSNFLYKCPMSNCQSSFRYDSGLQIHLRLHYNDLEQCQYCPYRYKRKQDYRDHLNRHFGILDFKCDQCGNVFNTQSQFNKHYEMHEGINYHCLLCEGYKASNKNAMNNHLRKKHPKLVGKNVTWESVEKFAKITK